jgi:hypothetical protein
MMRFIQGAARIFPNGKSETSMRSQYPKEIKGFALLNKLSYPPLGLPAQGRQNGLNRMAGRLSHRTIQFRPSRQPRILSWADAGCRLAAALGRSLMRLNQAATFAFLESIG